jgi:adenylylsulfate kinase
MIYWFYGQPGSGKTTLANGLKEHLEYSNHRNVQHIDGDEIRKIFQNKDYSKEGRINNLRKVNTLIRFLNYKDFDVVVSVVAPYNEVRNEIKDLNPQMIYVKTSEIRGRENYFADDFEFNTNDICVDTTDRTPLDCLNEILTLYR